MKYLVLAVVFSTGYLAANLATLSTAANPLPAKPPAAAPNNPPANPAIDMAGFLKNAQEAAKHRESRRVTEEEFIKMSAEEGTIVLDARSKEMYDLLHIKGAINLSFPNIDTVSLPKVLPDKKARILIYCNNNFTNPAATTTAKPSAEKPSQELAAIAKQAFASKDRIASLNLSTYIALYGYGYKNVYELAPLIEPTKAKLMFESTLTAR